MSLKAFHIFFISLCLILCVGFLAWTIFQFKLGTEGVSLSLIASILIGSLGLLGYFIWFLTHQKQKIIS